MDDKTATRVGDLVPLGRDSPKAELAPMYLIVLAGSIPGAMHKLAHDGSSLGRSTDNTVHLPEPSVSRHHAYLQVDEDGRVRLTDLASTNGTTLNGRLIPNHTPVAIQDGDRLQFGPSTIAKFVRPDPTEEKYQRDLYERIVRDALTGLFNRAYFLDQIGHLTDRSARSRLGLAILMIDIDHFKRVNDTLGHDAGDAVIREVAGVIRQSLRPEDLVARYGGEEFVVALPIASTELAAERAEHIRRNLSARRVDDQDRPGRVTVSIGLAFAPPGQPQPISTLLSIADACLYRAKNAGRDRVICGRGPFPMQEEPRTKERDRLRSTVEDYSLVDRCDEGGDRV